MKSLKKIIKTKLQHSGCFIQLIPEVKIQFFKSGKSLYSYFLKQDPNQQTAEYKRLIDLIADAKNHRLYQELLMEMYAELPDYDDKASFISKNHKSSRNRKIQIAGERYFEKNYLKTGHELETILWVDKNLYSFLKNCFTIPKIIHSYEGNFSTLLHLEYLNLEKIDVENPFPELIETCLDLYEISLKEMENLSQLKWNSIILDFEKLFYKENISAAKNDLLEKGISPEKIWSKVLSSTYVLTHGDLHAENVYRKKHVIDWDNFGFYPIGMDAAFIYMFYFENFYNKISFEIWLNETFSHRIQSENWKEFERNMFFYAFLFLHMRKDKAEFSVFHRKLIENLKILFEV